MLLRRIATGFLFVLVVIWGCADTEYVSEGGADEDEDGYGETVDCDDRNPDINPGAPELENCRDDNCDGKIDEGTVNEDVDGDGFCPSNGDNGTCEGNPLRNPGMAEDGGDGSQEPNGIDDNCNGIVDDGLPTSDMDNDGFTQKDGDCNDGDDAINPGAIEVEGMACKVVEDCPIGKCYDGYCRCVNDEDCSTLATCDGDEDCPENEECISDQCKSSWVCMDPPEGMASPELKVCRDNADNDCDGDVDEMPAVCDALEDLVQTEANDFAKAIELCDTDHVCGIEKACPGQLACVNDICRRVTLAQFNSESSPSSRAIADQFAVGGPLVPRKNNSFVILATGNAVYNPATLCPQPGTSFYNTGIDPDPAIQDKEANDLSELKLEILVPTNARSFSFDFQFMTTEYPEYLDTMFNDTFWVQLNSQKLNGNISFDKAGTPVRLNNAFFDICDPSPMHPQTQQYCTKPASTLMGTGYATICCAGEACGGSTGWLTTTAPVEPGEKITLTFSIFDKGDHILDSAVLIDNFRWHLTPAASASTVPQ